MLSRPAPARTAGHERDTHFGSDNMTATRARLAPLAWGMVLFLACSWGSQAAPQITVSQSDALQVDVDTNTVVNPGDTIRYTIRIANTGDTAAASVALEQFLDANTMLVPGSLRTSPIARDDSYHTEPGVSLTNTAPGVLANDSDADGDTPQVQTLSPVSDQGVTVNLAANGAFTYAPPPAYTGLDAFVYMIVDDDGMTNDARVVINISTAGPPPVAAADGSFTYMPDAGFTGADTFAYTIRDIALRTDSATVTVQVDNVVWFVDNTAPGGGDGRITNRFDALSEVSNAGDPDGPDEIIYVYEGDGSRYAGGILLETGQTLVGEGVALATGAGLTVPPHSRSLPGAGTAPRIDGAPAIALVANNTIRGVALDTTAGAGITGSAVGNLVVANVPSLQTDGGAGIDIEDGTLAVTIGSVTVANSLTDGIRLVNVNGTTSFNTLSVDNTNGTGVLLSDAGTFNLNSTTASVLTRAGPALEIDNTTGQTNGAAGWVFDSVTSIQSPRDGVTFDTVGEDVTLRNLNIVGPIGDGLKLTNVNADVTLDRGIIDGDDTDGHAVSLYNVTGGTTIRGQNSGNRLVITNACSALPVLGGHSGIHMVDSGDLDVRFVDVSDIGNSSDEHGVHVESPKTGNRSISIADSDFLRIGDSATGAGAGCGVDLGVPASAGYTGTLAVAVRNNVFQGNGTNFVTTDTAVNLNFQAGANGTLNANVSQNDIDGVRSGIRVQIAGAAGSGLNGRNWVTVSWNTGDDFDNDGIEIDIGDDAGGIGGSQTRVFVDHNTLNAITAYTNGMHDPDEAIEIEVRGSSSAFSTVNVDVVNNTIGGASTNAGGRWDGNGITVGSAGGPGLNATIFVDIDGNNIDRCEDAGILLKADETVTNNLRVVGNMLGTTGEGIQIDVESDPYLLRTYFRNNDPGSGHWDLTNSVPGVLPGVWELGVTPPNTNINSLLTTPSSNAVFGELLFGEGNSTNGLAVGDGASILIIDESTIPGGN